MCYVVCLCVCVCVCVYTRTRALRCLCVRSCTYLYGSSRSLSGTVVLQMLSWFFKHFICYCIPFQKVFAYPCISKSLLMHPLVVSHFILNASFLSDWCFFRVGDMGCIYFFHMIGSVFPRAICWRSYLLAQWIYLILFSPQIRCLWQCGFFQSSALFPWSACLLMWQNHAALALWLCR